MHGIWVAILVVLALTFFGFGDSSETKTIYLMECDKPVKHRRCEGNATLSDVFTVRVFPESQRVIMRAAAIGALSYGDCTVFDGDNWSCEYEDGSAGNSMANGDYYHTETKEFEPKEFEKLREKQFQVSSLRYLYAWIRELF